MPVCAKGTRNRQKAYAIKTHLKARVSFSEDEIWTPFNTAYVPRQTFPFDILGSYCCRDLASSRDWGLYEGIGLRRSNGEKKIR